MAVVGDFCYYVIEGSSKNVGILPMHTTIQSFVDALSSFQKPIGWKLHTGYWTRCRTISLGLPSTIQAFSKKWNAAPKNL